MPNQPRYKLPRFRYKIPPLKFKKADPLAAVEIILRAVRDSADVFPPLKSAAATVLILMEMSKKVNSNKEDCKDLAIRAAEIFHDIWRQTKDYGELPTEVQYSIDQIERIFHDIIDFMRDLETQNFVRRYARQDDNKGRIERFTKLLDEGILLFGVNLQISVYRLHTETSQVVKNTLLEWDGVSRERHNEVLDVAQMSEKEREQLLTKLLEYAQFGKSRSLFFF
jgi:hypothetical protein